MEQTILLVIQVIVGIALVGLILIQQGKGADMGASFGSGASQTIFGSSGSGNFLTRSTAILATVFFLSSLGLAYVARHEAKAEEQIQISVPGGDQSSEEMKVDLVPVEEGDLPEVESGVSDIDAPKAIEIDVPVNVPPAESVEPAKSEANIEELPVGASEEAKKE